MGRDHTDQKRGDGQMSGDEERAKGSEPHRTVRWRTDGRMTQQEGGGGGPTLIKRRKTEDVRIACAPLIRALKSQPLERCVLDSGPPPPPPRLKVERRGGSGITLRVIDLGASIAAVEEVRPRFRTPPPPPLLCLKVERRGGSGILCASLIRAREFLAIQTCLPLTTGAF
jgi:hypothetical protein